MKTTFTMAVLASAAVAKKCPDLSAFRTQNVIDNFDVNKLMGKWYETAYNDIA